VALSETPWILEVAEFHTTPLPIVTFGWDGYPSVTHEGAYPLAGYTFAARVDERLIHLDCVFYSGEVGNCRIPLFTVTVCSFPGVFLAPFYLKTFGVFPSVRLSLLAGAETEGAREKSGVSRDHPGGARQGL